MKSLVLLSGGIDSTVCLYLIKQIGYENIYAISFNYNQTHKKELEYAKKIAEINNIPHHIINIELPPNPLTIQGSNVLGETDGVSNAHVAGRNTVFLANALSYAETNNINYIFAGYNYDDHLLHPDCTIDFINGFNNLLKSLNLKIFLLTPLLTLNKREVIRLGKLLNIPFEYTWSCYKGLDQPCGQCNACLLREKYINQK